MNKTVWAVLGVMLLAPSSATAVPFHACTLWQPPYSAFNRSCASFRTAWGACQTPYCGFWGCVWLPGVQFSGWFPEYLVEVTNRAGHSAFTAVDAPAMALQMGSAAANWAAHGDPWGLRVKDDRPQNDSDISLYHGRALPIPYGTLGAGMKSLNINPGTPAPTCFSAVTEMVAETWSDNPLSGDRELAAAWSPITAPACTLGAPLLGTVAAIPLGGAGVPDVSSGCAFPLPPWAQRTLALTGASAYDPTKQCMGALGGLLPRTGWTDGEPWTAAQRVAWRTASLGEDYFHAGPGVRSNDKWQVLWPRMVAPRCWAPGSVLRPSTNPPDVLLRTEGYDNIAVGTALGGAPFTEAVFVVWRHRSQCVKTERAVAMEAEIALWEIDHTIECAPINVAFPGPLQ